MPDSRDDVKLGPGVRGNAVEEAAGCEVPVEAQGDGFRGPILGVEYLRVRLISTAMCAGLAY